LTQGRSIVGTRGDLKLPRIGGGESDREVDEVLRTELSDLVGIDAPIIQAPIVPGAGPELVAAVGEAGAIGSLGAAFKTANELRAEIEAVRRLTDRPFIVNHVVPLLDEEAFSTTLEASPRMVSLALGDPGEHVARAKEAGALVMHQVHTREQARAVAETGVDVIVAQGTEAGGNCGGVATSVLVPQVVEEVGPIPVVAAGGIADGRGLAAALVLGAQGANVGTRFLASEEASVDAGWKEEIVSAHSEQAVRLGFWEKIFGGDDPQAYEVVPRALRTPFVDEWSGRPDEAGREAERLRGEIASALRAGTIHQLAPFSGQGAGLISDVQPAGEIVRAMVEEAEDALRRAASFAAAG
jgi:nitronate monooxygenase/enoyl-[acyl-carrier protein] reductase II